MAKKQKKSPKKAAKKSATKASPKKVTTKTGLQPIGDGVLIAPEAAETTSPSGIIIPDTVKQEKTTFGRIVAVGEGRIGENGALIKMRLSAGQKVYFNPGWENEIEYQSEKYFLVRESDVKAVIN
ncbi:MAG: co-chaperone GroES [Patescibacteria group bacterium]